MKDIFALFNSKKNHFLPIILILLLVWLCFLDSVSAEIIILKSGKKVEGKIVERTNDYIKVDCGIDMVITYYLGDILSIDGESVVLTKNLIEDNKPNNILSNEVNDQIIFSERLTELIKIIFSKEEDIGSISSKNLETFPDEFPESKFADDAKFLLLSMVFTGAADTRNREKAEEYLKEMKEFVVKYPDVKLEEFTYQKWQELLGEKAAWALYIYVPYSQILAYLRGYLEFYFKNYAEVIENYSIVKDNLDYSLDKRGLLAFDIYSALAVSYDKLGNKSKVKEISSEAQKKFPDNKKLMDMMKVILQ